MANELAEFEKIVATTLSPNNNERKAAEAALDKVRSIPDKFAHYLTVCLRESKSLEARQMCAVLLRQLCITSALLSPTEQPTSIYTKLPPTIQTALRNTLLEIVRSDNNRVIRHRSADCVGVLSSTILLNKQQWPELIALLGALSNSQQLSQRETSLYLLEKLSEFSVKLLLPHIATVKKICQANLTDAKASFDLQLAATRAVCSFVVSAKEDNERNQFVDIVPLIFASIGRAFEQKEDEALTGFAQSLVMLAKNHPFLLRSTLTPIVTSVAKVISCKELEDATRRTWMEFLLTLSEKGGGMVRKTKGYPEAVLNVAMSLTLEVPNDPEWDQDLEQKDMDADEYQNYQMGLESMDRLAFAFGPQIFLKHVWPTIEQWVNPQRPALYRQAALMILAEAIEACAQELKPKLGNLINMIVPYISNDSDSRVRWAAVNAIAQFSIDFAPETQNKYHAKIIPALLAAMDQNTIRLVRHSMLCFIDFSANADKKHLTPHLDVLFQKMLRILNTNNLRMQETALGVISSVAINVEEGMAKYYTVLLPLLKKIFASCKTKEMRELRSKAMECIGYLGRAVGKDTFLNDAKETMDVLLKTYNVGFEADDPQYRVLIETFGRIAQAIGEDFAPYLQFVIPPLLASAAVENVVFIFQEGEVNPYEHDERFKTIPYEIRKVGKRFVSVNGALLEEKSLACSMLHQYAQNLKDGFFPYVDKTCKLLVPLTRWLFHESVRHAAIMTLPHLLVSAHIHFKKQGQVKEGQAYVKSMFDYMFKAYVECIKAELSIDSLNAILDSLADSLTVLELPLNAEQLTELCEVLHQHLTLEEERRAKREERRRSPDYDEEEARFISEENEKEDDFLGYIFQVVSKLARVMGPEFVPYFQKHFLPLFAPMLDPKKSVGQRVASICSFDDVIMYCGAPARVYVEKFLPIVLKEAKNSNVEIRQSALFGIGACAASIGVAFGPAVGPSLKILLEVIDAKDSREDENDPATDNGISAVGKIILHCTPHLLPAKPDDPNSAPASGFPLGQLLSHWLQWLPCVSDEEEAQVVHGHLLQFLINPKFTNPLLGPNNKNLPKVVGIIADILNTDLVSLETQTKLLEVWKKMGAAIPANVMPQLLASLTENQQKRCHSLMLPLLGK